MNTFRSAISPQVDCMSCVVRGEGGVGVDGKWNHSAIVFVAIGNQQQETHSLAKYLCFGLSVAFCDV